MSDRSWKATERATARRLGGSRTGVNRQREAPGLPDVQHPQLSVECKHRKFFPSWLKGAVRQAQVASRSDQLPIAVLHELNARYDSDLVAMTMRDFEDWHGAT